MWKACPAAGFVLVSSKTCDENSLTLVVIVHSLDELSMHVYNKFMI